MRFTLGVVALYFFVLLPARANFVLTLAQYAPLDSYSKINLLAIASDMDRGNPEIYEALGIEAAKEKKWIGALYAFENAARYAPNRAATWLRLGEVMFNVGEDGTNEMRYAIELEPNNPMFKSEVERITKIQRLSPLW